MCRLFLGRQNDGEESQWGLGDTEALLAKHGDGLGTEQERGGPGSPWHRVLVPSHHFSEPYRGSTWGTRESPTVSEFPRSFSGGSPGTLFPAQTELRKLFNLAIRG